MTENAAAAPSFGLGVLDWLVIALYASGMLAIGVYYARRHKTAEDYHLGGRKMRPGMVGLSLYATMISTISYLAVPGEVLRHGPVYLAGIAALPMIFLIVGYVLVPRIMRLPIVSAYEILDRRFGRGVRILGSCMFLFMRFVWMGLVLLTSARVIVHVTGLSEAHMPYVSLALGLVTVVYSSLGGLQAVVLTDVIQTTVLFSGALLTILLVTLKTGGVGWFPTEWASNWDTQPVFSLDPHVRVTLIGTLLAQIIWWTCTAGSDQMAIQRYLATRDARSARRAFLINNCADATVTLLLALLGFALLGFFRAHPEFLRPDLNLETNADYLFPYFVVRFFGYGLSGLVVSGILAAAMSSLSSGVNSTCAVIQTDLIEPATGGGNERHRVLVARAVSLSIGLAAIAFSLVVGQVRGNLMEVTSKTSNLLVAPLFGLFFFAIFVPFSTPLGAVYGSIYGFLAAFFVAFWDLTGAEPLSWQWILPCALIADVVSGTLLSLASRNVQSRTGKAILGVLFALPAIAAAVAFALACAFNGTTGP